MTSLGLDGTEPPDQVCVRCSKPIVPGTASRITGRPVHMRCLARDVQLDTVAQRERIQLDRQRVRAARARAEELIDTMRRFQTICPACGEGFGPSRGVLFHGDHLVHASCWRADPKPFDQPPPE